MSNQRKELKNKTKKLYLGPAGSHVNILESQWLGGNTKTSSYKLRNSVHSLSLSKMAAETFVFNIVAKVLRKIGSPAFQEACLVWGVESDLNRLENTLSTIKAMLLDAEEQQVHNQELTVWLGQLKEVFYDAQDVLDEFECEALRRLVVEIQGSTTRKVRRFFSSSNSLVFRTKMAHKVKEIRAR